MSTLVGQTLFWGLAAVALTGAATVVLTRDVMRLVLGLGAFLLAVAGYFLLYGAAFLAVAQVFLYVGGVLVLVLFAIMLLHRTEKGTPDLDNRHDVGSAMVAVALFVLLVTSLQGSLPSGAAAAGAGIEAVGDRLLGALLPHFELVGALLLAALVAVLSIVGGERR
ncbi:MAG: NADH-quinone oxidoreductase subunit J [Coriobacteriia bacterium]|nr:NADH-quinone oxidoreductase subunit J [Coriobacteriia bacterium]